MHGSGLSRVLYLEAGGGCGGACFSEAGRIPGSAVRGKAGSESGKVIQGVEFRAMELFLNTLGFLGLKDRSCTEFTRVLSQPKRFALLVFLSVEGPNEFIQRETLLSVFWPEESERRARNALSQALSFLRRQLPAGSIQTLGVTGVRLAE